MPCNVLQPPSTFYSSYHTISLFLLYSSFAFSFCTIQRSRSSVVAVFDRNSISTGLPLSPTTPLLLYATLCSLLLSLPSLHSGNPEHPGKQATGCIPCNKLRGSIIHGNLLRLCLRRGCSFFASPPGLF